MARHAAPSRNAPNQINDLEAGRDLNIGEYTDEPTLNLSEARIILNKTMDTRLQRGIRYQETDNLVKSRVYLDLFSSFKDLPDAQAAEAVINTYAKGMALFEKSQLGSLCPTTSDEAKALIPSLEKKVEDKIIDEDELQALCVELNRVKRQAQL